MHRKIWMVLILGASFCAAPAAVTRAADGGDWIAPVRARLAADRALLKRAPEGSLDEARLAMATGDLARARGAVEARLRADSSDFDARLTRCRLDLAEYRFGEAKDELASLTARHPEHAEVRRLQLRLDFVRDDLESAERHFGAALAADTSDNVGLLFAARFQHLTLQFEPAIQAYARALRHARVAEDSVRALEGLSACWLQKGDKDAALRYVTRAALLRGADDGLLFQLASVLIKLGRAADATSALELATQINPCNENAQYFLGNGYARVNYSELHVSQPQAFADSSERPRLERADSLWNSGRREEARAQLGALIASNPRLAEAHNYLGSYDYEEGRAAEALAEYREALRLCPGYGRARNGIARALELNRRAANSHRDAYESAFAAAEWPAVPGIEKLVLNYSTLTPRIQKRVSLSVAPWKAFVPVLVEGGATFYIKHLHEVLSHCPGQELLKDQRISYDLRLWDDVRGCGGYRTVTGIEDVEGTLQGGYNTVIHELTHQVHGVLTADLGREIQDLYRNARARMDSGKEAFVSLYQASSVYEYLAEGVNSIYTPRRDRFDTREILRERLEARDPDLIAEIHKLMGLTDVDRFYAVAYGNAGDDRLERGLANESVEYYKKALARDSSSEEAPARLSNAYSVLGRGEEAVAAVKKAAGERPASAGLQLQLISAEYVRTGDRKTQIGSLQRARAGVDSREHYLVDNSLGHALLDDGELDPARASADSLLAYQSDSPEGLELRGELEAAAGRPDSSRAYFERALRVRSGWLGLRVAYASTLLERPGRTASDVEEASRQIEAARQVDPRDPRVAMLDGWLLLAKGKADSAEVALQKVSKENDWLDLARILQARARAERGDRAEAAALVSGIESRLKTPAPLRFLYNPRQGSYEQVGELGWIERAQMRSLSAAAPHPIKRGE